MSRHWEVRTASENEVKIAPFSESSFDEAKCFVFVAVPEGAGIEEQLKSRSPDDVCSARASLAAPHGSLRGRAAQGTDRSVPMAVFCTSRCSVGQAPVTRAAEHFRVHNCYPSHWGG